MARTSRTHVQKDLLAIGFSAAFVGCFFAFVQWHGDTAGAEPIAVGLAELRADPPESLWLRVTAVPDFGAVFEPAEQPTFGVKWAFVPLRTPDEMRRRAAGEEIPADVLLATRSAPMHRRILLQSTVAHVLSGGGSPVGEEAFDGMLRFPVGASSNALDVISWKGMGLAETFTLLDHGHRPAPQRPLLWAGVGLLVGALSVAFTRPRASRVPRRGVRSRRAAV